MDGAGFVSAVWSRYSSSGSGCVHHYHEKYGQFGWKYGWNCIRNDRKSGENNRIQWVLLDYWNGGIFVKICPG